MGEQLDLFTRGGSGAATQGPEQAAGPRSEPAPEPASPAELPGQFELFGDRWLRASAAHKALESFDLESACAGFEDAVRRYPADPALAERRDSVVRLEKALRDARSTTSSAADALAAIETRVPAFAKAAWHRAQALAVEHDARTGAPRGGFPSGAAGWHWLRGGELAEAERSLRATLDSEPSNARVRAYLGDALFSLGREGEARVAYREALSSSPAEVDLDHLLDPAVRDLPALAEYDYEQADDPLTWVATVGILEGVFIPPRIALPDWLDPATLERLAAGLRFYRWLVAERAARTDAERIACRRAMKQLSASLFQAVLARRR